VTRIFVFCYYCLFLDEANFVLVDFLCLFVSICLFTNFPLPGTKEKMGSHHYSGILLFTSLSKDTELALRRL
jgi:hypothetical protein